MAPPASTSPPQSVYAAPDVPIGSYVSPQQGNNPRYSVEEYAQHAFLTSPSGAWSPTLRASPENVPDTQRLNQQPLRDYRPDAAQPPEHWWTGVRGPGRETIDRHRVETVDGDGWEMQRGDTSSKRAIPDIRRTPPPEPRRTNSLAPTTYWMTRPFDQEMEKLLNGQHFSMADHRRNYEIYGMAPAYTRRNTYRVDPPPWDEDIVDRRSSPIVAVEVPDSAGRSWRL